MKILIAVFGSYGHYSPLISLAQTLRTAGHNVIFAIQDDDVEDVKQYGFDVTGIMPVFESDDMRQQSYLDFRKYVINRFMVDSLHEKYVSKLEQLVIDVDLIIRDPQIPAASLLAEKYDIPLVDFLASPMHLNTTSDIARNINNLWLSDVNACRNRLGLSETDNIPFNVFQNPTLKIGPFPFFYAKDTVNAKSPDLVCTNFSLLLQDTEVPPEIEQFLDGGEPPVVFSMGSFGDVGVIPNNLFEIASKLTDTRRILILTGKRKEELPENQNMMVYSGFVPHHKIFPRCSLVIHHGGIGTLSKCLLTNTPQIAIPQSQENMVCSEMLPDLISIIRPEEVTEQILRGKIHSIRYDYSLGKEYSEYIKNNDANLMILKVLEDKYFNEQCITIS